MQRQQIIQQNNSLNQMQSQSQQSQPKSLKWQLQIINQMQMQEEQIAPFIFNDKIQNDLKQNLSYWLKKIKQNIPSNYQESKLFQFKYQKILQSIEYFNLTTFATFRIITNKNILKQIQHIKFSQLLHIMLPQQQIKSIQSLINIQLKNIKSINLQDNKIFNFKAFNKIYIQYQSQLILNLKGNYFDNGFSDIKYLKNRQQHINLCLNQQAKEYRYQIFITSNLFCINKLLANLQLNSIINIQVLNGADYMLNKKQLEVLKRRSLEITANVKIQPEFINHEEIIIEDENMEQQQVIVIQEDQQEMIVQEVNYEAIEQEI